MRGFLALTFRERIQISKTEAQAVAWTILTLLYFFTLSQALFQLYF